MRTGREEKFPVADLIAVMPSITSFRPLVTVCVFARLSFFISAYINEEKDLVVMFPVTAANCCIKSLPIERDSDHLDREGVCQY